MARTAGSHSDVTGPRVRAAALKLFAQSGYGAVSMRQIAAEVGVQAGALYLYTPDKQTLLFDLMRGHMDDVLAEWAAEPKGDGPLAALEAFTRFHLRFHLDRHEAVFLAYMELRSLEPANLAVIEAMRGEYQAGLEAILRDGHTAGVFNLPDPKIAALALMSMLTGVSSWYRDGGRLSRERVERIYWNLTRKAVRA